MSPSDAKRLDALRWVAQEAFAVVAVGAQLPRGSRLREALKALADLDYEPEPDDEYARRLDHLLTNAAKG